MVGLLILEVRSEKNGVASHIFFGLRKTNGNHREFEQIDAAFWNQVLQNLRFYGAGKVKIDIPPGKLFL